MAKLRTSNHLRRVTSRLPLDEPLVDYVRLSKYLQRRVEFVGEMRGLTKMDLCAIIDSVADREPADQDVLRQKRPHLSVLCDRLQHLPSLMARNNDSNNLMSRTQLSRSKALSRSRNSNTSRCDVAEPARQSSRRAT